MPSIGKELEGFVYYRYILVEGFVEYPYIGRQDRFEPCWPFLINPLRCPIPAWLIRAALEV